DLSERDKLLHGGGTGAAVVPGNARESLLYKLVTHTKEPHMPHNAAKLPREAIAAIANWIDCGAPYDGSLLAGPDKESGWTRKIIPEETKQFWSFQPLLAAVPPAVHDESWARTPIDRFVLARLEKAGVKPQPEADKVHLLRRAYF